MQSNLLRLSNFKVSPAYRFLIKLFLIYFGLQLLDHYLQANAAQGELLGKMSYWVTLHTSYLLDLLGYQSSCNFTGSSASLLVDGIPSVAVAYPCNGVSLFLVFTSFMLATNLRNKHLIWFWPMGLFVIHIINVIRVSALALIYKYYPNHLPFNHKYVFTIIVYAAIISLFVVFIKFFNALNDQELEGTEKI